MDINVIEVNEVKLNLVPQAEIDLMARALLSTIEKFFSDPKNKKDFEKWQQERRHG